MALSRHSVGTYPETSSHATSQGTLGYSRLNSLSHCGNTGVERTLKKHQRTKLTLEKKILPPLLPYPFQWKLSGRDKVNGGFWLVELP